MPREPSPNVLRAREHLARADRLLAMTEPAPPSAPVTPAPAVRPSPFQLARQ